MTPVRPAKCGVDLDAKSTVTGSDHTTRYDGVSMIMAIVYSNSEPFTGPTGHISYEYHITAQYGAKSKSDQEIFPAYPKQVCCAA